jgi:hypothetical protein
MSLRIKEKAVSKPNPRHCIDCIDWDDISQCCWREYENINECEHNPGDDTMDIDDY